MSHITTGEICITDLNALDMAVRQLGGELMREQTTFNWFGVFMNDSQEATASIAAGYDPKKFGECDHAIRIPGHVQGKKVGHGDYEVGVVRRPDGKGWNLQWDGFGPRGERIHQHFGQKCSVLKTEYGVAAIRRAVRGKRVEVVRKDGKARVRVHA